MDNASNGSSCAFHGSPNYAVLVLILLAVVGIVGNALVCLSIVVERRLQNATNFFLFSLAVADLMVSLFVMPATIAMEYHRDEWTHGFNFCLVHISLDVVLCSVSIVHMVVISIDRYRGISQPFKERNKTKLLVSCKVAVIWLTTGVICCPLIVSALRNPEGILHDCRCGIFPNTKITYFQIYGTVVVFALPSTIMIIAYARTVKLLRQQMALATGKNPKLRRHSAPQRKNRSNRINLGQIRATIYRYTDYFIENQNPAASGIATMQSVNQALFERIQERAPQTRKFGVYNRRQSMKAEIKYAAMAYLLMNRKDSPAMVMRERKATTVLAVVFFSFFFCWSPFFISNITIAICGDKCGGVPKGWVGFALWLGYFSSIINPVIYTLFNRRYRVTFYRLLCFKWHRATKDLVANSKKERGLALGEAGAGLLQPSSSSSKTRRRHVESPNRVAFRVGVGTDLTCEPQFLAVEARTFAPPRVIGFWVYGYGMCVVYTALDVLLCSSSIVHMAVISIDRYRGISTPFKTRNTTYTEVAVKVLLIWTLSTLVGSPICILALLNPGTIWTGCHCGIFPNFKIPEFQIYGTVLTFLLPSAVMLVTYVRTVRLLRAQMQLALGANPALRRNTKSAPATQPLLIMTAADMVEHQEHDKDAIAGITSIQSINRVFYAIMMRKKRKRNVVQRKIGIGRPSMKANMKKAAVAYYLMSRKDSKALVKKEKKATTVLGVVFGSFFICWSPFFLTNLILAMCGHTCRRFPAVLAAIFLWLGYFSSIINPLIYTAFNSIYRITFLNILRMNCGVFARQRSRRQSNVHSTTRFQLKDFRTLRSTTIISRGERTLSRVEEEPGPKPQDINADGSAHPSDVFL